MALTSPHATGPKTTWPLTTRTVRASGLDFACNECGEGDAVALRPHGFPAARSSGPHQRPARAAAGWRAVAPDLRGYGESSRPRERSAYEMRHLIEDAAALFDALGARRRLLVGHDWGAAIAWSFALRRTRPLDGLIVMNVPHPEVFRRVLARSWAQRLRSWYVAFFQVPALPEALLTAGGARAVERAFLRMARNPQAFPREVLDRYRDNALVPGAMTAMLNYYRANAAGFLRSAPAEPVGVPTLMVWGEHDSALGLELTEGYDGLVEDFTLHRLPDASHWVQQDRPETVNAILVDWLAAKRLGPADPAGRPE